MKIALEITEAPWAYAVAKYNAQKATESQNAATFAARRGEPAPAEFAPLNIDEYVAQILGEKEAAILAEQIREHDAAILAASPKDKARIAKVLAQPDETKDAVRAQIDSI